MCYAKDGLIKLLALVGLVIYEMNYLLNASSGNEARASVMEIQQANHVTAGAQAPPTNTD